MAQLSRHLPPFIRERIIAYSAIAAVLFLNRARRRYLYHLRRSGLFDRDFYRRQNPQLMRLYLALPERHYIVHGEAAGLFPNAKFSPGAYLRLNPDAAESREPPLLHYLLAGRAAALKTRDPSPVDALAPAPLPAIPTRPPRAELAAVVHVFYPELWPEIDQYLRASGLRLDRFITVTDLGETSRRLADDLQSRYPEDLVLLMPNHGRDIFPWVALINAGALSGYRAICKLHTKRSPHLRDGAQWRQEMLAGLLPPGRGGQLIEDFLSDGEAGMLTTAGQRLQGPEWWGANQGRAATLLARAGVAPDPQALSFAAGSMFWAKPALLSAIAGLRLTAQDFEAEQGATDGCTAHAFERVLGYLLQVCGQQIRDTTELAAARRS